MTESENRLLQYITNFFITVLTGIAFKKAVDSLMDMINEGSLQLYVANSWVLPLVFFITLIRFSFGNIAHAFHLSGTHSRVSPLIILYDLTFIIVEFLLLSIMGSIFHTKEILFVTLLIILFLTDAIWIGTMIPMACVGWRPQVPYIWGVLNTCVAAILLIIVAKDPNIFLTLFGSATLLLLSLIAAALDVIIVDHYHLLKSVNSSK